MKVKSKEVAEALGVSTATVSLAINGKPGVNEETRKRILEYISGQQGKDVTKGTFVKLIIFENSPRVLSGGMGSFFRITYVESVERLQKDKLEVRLVYAYGYEELKEALLKSNTDGTKGILLRADEFGDKDYELISLCRIPLVMSDCDPREYGWNTVNFNNRQAVFKGMNHLKAHGCRKIVYFQNTEAIYNFRARREAFWEYMKRNPEMEGSFWETGNDLEEIEKRAAEYIRQCEEMPDAVFLENFLVSVGTAQALMKMGISVPDQISLLGIDAIPATVLLPDELTHFEVPHKKRSVLMAELLIELMNRPDDGSGRVVLVNEKMAVGNSVNMK